MYTIESAEYNSANKNAIFFHAYIKDMKFFK